MFHKNGIYTYSPLHRSSVANYPDKSNELSRLFPNKSNDEIQKLLNDDMMNFVEITNKLHPGDVLQLDDTFDLDYEFHHNDDEELHDKLIQVIDLHCGVVIFKKPFKNDNKFLTNIDQQMTLKEYANLDLTKVIDNDSSFSVDSHVRTIFKVNFMELNTGNKYYFNLNNNNKYKLLKRLEIGDKIKLNDILIGDDIFSIKEISSNYLKLDDIDHYNYIKDNIGQYRDNISNSYRFTIKLDNDQLINLHDDDKLTINCDCVSKSDLSYRTICSCHNESSIDQQLIDMMGNSHIS
jgi:hypothetical protein